MEKLIGILTERLAGKGMEVSTIPAFIRDLANTMVAHGYSSLQELNRRLRSLGWDDFELDHYTFQLIVAIFERDLAYKPPHWFDRTFDTKTIPKLPDKKVHVQRPRGKRNKLLEG
ncbi:MAG: hypothetical protein HWN70_11290 [Desulfobacterales bacterium]|nr:hypothetical protein [Desulfobacterales bacterium]